MSDMRPPPGYVPPGAFDPPEHVTAREMGINIADMLGDMSRWLGRVLTIAVGVCLGMILFAWIAGQWLKHELRHEITIPSWPTTTTITWPIPTTYP